MWYLVNSTGYRLYLKPNAELTFGRKKADILLQNDESISRLHASIYIEPRETMTINEPTSMCKLKDMDSKYGTYVILDEEDKFEISKEWYNLKNNDKIQFGLQQHIFTVMYMPIIIVISSLNDNDKNKLQELIDEIDGMITTDWTTACTHLTVSKAALTEKVTWAMASVVPIVTLGYWEKVKHAIDNGNKFPKVDSFVPQINESLIIKGNVSLFPNEKRKTLFQNLIFVFFNVRQYKIYGRMINMADGKLLLYSKKPLTNDELCAGNVVVLQYSNNDATQSTQCVVPEYDSICNTLRANKRRMISESEIPLAILHCCTDKYCNPKFTFTELLKRTQPIRDSSEVLVIDTQDVLSNKGSVKVVSSVPIKLNKVIIPSSDREAEVIPESYDTNIDSLNKVTTSSDREVKIIPESYDIDSLNNSNISQRKESLKTSTPKGANSTSDLDTNKTVKDIGEIEVIHYIPETNNSSISNVSQELLQCSVQETLSLKKQDTEKETRLNKAMDLIPNEHIQLKVTQVNEDECDKIPNIVMTQKKVNKLLLVATSERDEIPEMKLSEKNNNNDNKNPLSSSSETTENDVRLKAGSKRSNDFESDDDSILPRKSIDTKKSGTTDTTNSSGTDDHSNHSDLPKCRSYFIRDKPGFKTFKKIYNVTLERRIKLNNMYVWNQSNIQGL
ncbi:nibrin [Colletes gigas]|uniref:nibrin n=1 Tax=Colletes gigas TaxID=935657 RepID=UPI001C9A8F82|nr:nibrin [Colletes gigas]